MTGISLGEFLLAAFPPERLTELFWESANKLNGNSLCEPLPRGRELESEMLVKYTNEMRRRLDVAPQMKRHEIFKPILDIVTPDKTQADDIANAVKNFQPGL